MVSSPRLGRPPAADSSATRATIMVVARQVFAELGYGGTTNKLVATKAGISTAALYHYFDSKLELYAAAYEDTEALITRRFTVAMAEHVTFVGRFGALLEAAYELNTHDPSLARFVAAVRTDVERHDELRQRLAASTATRSFSVVDQLVDMAVGTGEIAASTRREAVAVLKALLAGLSGETSRNPVVHRAAIDGVKLLIEGRFIQSVW